MVRLLLLQLLHSMNLICIIAQSLNWMNVGTVRFIWFGSFGTHKKFIFMRYLTYINSFNFACYSEVSRDLFSDGRRRRHSKHLKLNTKFLKFIKRNRLAPVWCFRSLFSRSPYCDNNFFGCRYFLSLRNAEQINKMVAFYIDIR